MAARRVLRGLRPQGRCLVSDAFERYGHRLKEAGYAVDESFRDRHIISCPLGEPHNLVFVRADEGGVTLAGDCWTRHGAAALDELRLVGARETAELLNRAE